MEDLTVRDLVKILLCFNQDAKISVIHDANVYEITDVGWDIDYETAGERNIKQEHLDAVRVHLLTSYKKEN